MFLVNETEQATFYVIGFNTMEKITLTKELLIQMLGEAYSEGWYGQLGERSGVVINILNKHMPKKTSTNTKEELLDVFGLKHSTYFTTIDSHPGKVKSTTLKSTPPGPSKPPVAIKALEPNPFGDPFVTIIDEDEFADNL